MPRIKNPYGPKVARMAAGIQRQGRKAEAEDRVVRKRLQEAEKKHEGSKAERRSGGERRTRLREGMQRRSKAEPHPLEPGKGRRRKVSSRPTGIGRKAESPARHHADVKERVLRGISRAASRAGKASKGLGKLSVYGTATEAFKFAIEKNRADKMRKRGLDPNVRLKREL